MTLSEESRIEKCHVWSDTV